MVLNTTGCDKRQRLAIQLTLKIDGEGRKSYGSVCVLGTSVTRETEMTAAFQLPSL